MKTIKIQGLSEDAFRKFGQFADLIHPDAFPKIGEGPGGFYRDMVELPFGGDTMPTVSVSEVYPGTLEARALEFHSRTGEGMLPLDEDVIICFAPATFDAHIPVQQVEAFHVPRNTLIMIRPGVWHSPAIVPGNAPVHMLVLLPERTYANDLHLEELSEAIELIR